MNRFTAIVVVAFSSFALRAQAPAFDDLKLQIHGYVTQGFLYTTNNNWATADSSDASAAFAEAVVNFTAQPEAKLRIGIQARYSLLGQYGNAVTLDWAQADYKVNEVLGFRVGKVKTPLGLFNEIQDIDPAFLWILLRQSIYPLPSRNSNLTHFGGVAYGTIPMAERLGKIEYHAFGGERVIPGNDGYFSSFRDQGISLPNSVTGPATGGSLRWRAPLHGLLLGAGEGSSVHENGPLTSSIAAKAQRSSARYQKDWTVAARYTSRPSSTQSSSSTSSTAPSSTTARSTTRTSNPTRA